MSAVSSSRPIRVAARSRHRARGAPASVRRASSRRDAASSSAPRVVPTSAMNPSSSSVSAMSKPDRAPRAGAHRDAEARRARLRTVHADEDAPLAPAAVRGVRTMNTRSCTAIACRSHERSPTNASAVGQGLRRDPDGAIGVAVVRGREHLARREQEALAGVGAVRPAEQPIVVASLQPVACRDPVLADRRAAGPSTPSMRPGRSRRRGPSDRSGRSRASTSRCGAAASRSASRSRYLTRSPSRLEASSGTVSTGPTAERRPAAAGRCGVRCRSLA